MTAQPSFADLHAHNQRVTRMLADPECVGELLLVGIGMARCVDLGDPPWSETGSMQMKLIADAVYGNRRLQGGILGSVHLHDRGDSRPRRRIRDVFFADRRRYCPDVDGDRSWANVTCGRPMVRREGLCGRSASSNARRLTDPATGQRRWIGHCSQPACKQWFTDLLDRNRAELAAHPAPVPPANTGGVLERHLPEIDWWAVWRHVDPQWSPPPEGRRFERPTLRLLVTDDDLPEPVSVSRGRPALVVHEGGWR
ncbi:hypothetical protein [Micromonospora sediminicola]|uniref:hypothetical protein n=1 Tax=Micromonospora sediminicola TaxID=946078 RepID=UPI00379304F7